jgi:hypothetical protein
LQPALDVRNLSVVPNGEIIGRFKPVRDPPTPEAMAGQARRSVGKRWAPHPLLIPSTWVAGPTSPIPSGENGAKVLKVTTDTCPNLKQVAYKNAFAYFDIVNKPQTHFSASEAATLLLREFRDHRERFCIFDDFDKAMSEMRTMVDGRLGTVGEPLRTVAERIFKICRDGFFLIRVGELKISYLAEALQHSIEVGNPLSLASDTRGLIEHLAALMFVSETLDRLLEALDGQGSESKINEALGRAEGTLRRSYYGKSPKGSAKGETAPHIESECLAALEKSAPDIREVYGYLCDYVHPNFGSNLLVSTGELGRGRLNPPADFHKDTIDQICRYCSRAMLLLKENTIRISAPLSRLQDLMDRCLVGGSKITNVFSRRSASPQGDGLTKETAFFFAKARTSSEAVELTYRFLRESGIELGGDKHIGGVENGFIYDVFPTSKGRLWFKIPMMKL